jgi:hypothetical protein
MKENTMTAPLTFPGSILRLLYWLYLKPFTLRRYVRGLDPRLDEKLELWQARDKLATSAGLRHLAWFSWAILAIGPLSVILWWQLLTGFTWRNWRVSLLSIGCFTIGLLYGQWLRWRITNRLVILAIGLTFGLAGLSAIMGMWGLPGLLSLLLGLLMIGLVLGSVGGPTTVLTIGLTGGLATLIAVSLLGLTAYTREYAVPHGMIVLLALGLPLGLAGGLASSVTGVLAVGLAFGLAGIGIIGLRIVGTEATILVSSLALAVAFGLGFVVGYFRMFLYVLEVPYGYVLAWLAEANPRDARRYLHLSPVYWHEMTWFALLGLDKHLVTIGRQDRQAGARSFRQGWAARNALVELTAMEMENVQDLTSMANMAERLVWLPAELPVELREVLPAIQRVVQRAKAVQESETLWNKRENLVRAREEVQAIRQAWGWNPRGRTAVRFGPILEDWLRILEREEQALADQQNRERLIPNVYVVGSPLVTGSRVFKGRRDLFLSLERILAGPADQRPTLLLYGQRRSGKTSVLHQLPVRLGPDYVPVFVDMQSAANAESASGLLYSLSRAITDSARDLRRLSLPTLSQEAVAADPYTAFQEWLREVEANLDRRLILLTLDEYERIEEMLNDGRIDRRILNLLRHLTQHHPPVTVLLSGSHTPYSMAAYWADYLIGVQLLRVSYLEETEARELIEKPIPDFPLQYEEAAAERILQATRGQPFLVQATCQRLVDQVNREHRSHVTLADTEAALESLVMADDTLYWRELWTGYASDDAQRAILSAIAHHQDEVIGEVALARKAGGEYSQGTISRLIDREILEKTEGGYRFQVELTRRWVERHGQ